MNTGVAERTTPIDSMKPLRLGEFVSLLMPAMERACADKLTLAVILPLKFFVEPARERGWSVRGMARKLGCSPSTVTAIVTRGRQLTRERQVSVEKH